MISIVLDTSGFDEIIQNLEDLAGTGLDGVMARSINRAADSVSTAVSRELRDITGLPYRDVREDVKVASRANTGNLEAVITIEGGYHNVGEFHPHETQEGISADPWGERHLFGGSFFIPTAGHSVFKREGRERFPIRPLWGPSLAVEATRDERVQRVAEQTAEEVFNTRLQHELSRLMSVGKPRESEGE